MIMGRNVCSSGVGERIRKEFCHDIFITAAWAAAYSLFTVLRNYEFLGQTGGFADKGHSAGTVDQKVTFSTTGVPLKFILGSYSFTSP